MNFIKKILLLYIAITLFIKTTNGKPTTDKHPVACQKIILSQTPGKHVSLWLLNLMTLLTALLFLTFLGIIKGIMGLFCCIPVGMWGLGSLIDLPQPLEHYQEATLQDQPVIYDHIGWPVHPETGKRSVRALSKKTEFCLNAIFFLTYPLAIMITICGSCCFQETRKDSENCQCINTITFDYSAPNKRTATKMKKARTLIKSQEYEHMGSIYEDDDTDEEKDVMYVEEQKQLSQDSLRRESQYD